MMVGWLIVSERRAVKPVRIGRHAAVVIFETYAVPLRGLLATLGALVAAKGRQAGIDDAI